MKGKVCKCTKDKQEKWSRTLAKGISYSICLNCGGAIRKPKQKDMWNR